MSETDNQIGYHKGSLECLLKERAELVKLVQIVTALVNMHSTGLKKIDPSFDLEAYAESVSVPLSTGGAEIDNIVNKKDDGKKKPHEVDANFVNFEEQLNNNNNKD